MDAAIEKELGLRTRPITKGWVARIQEGNPRIGKV